MNVRRPLTLTGLLPLILVLAPIPVLVADEAVNFEGSFVWHRGDEDRTGDLTAVFTRDGDDGWTVAFHFLWEDEPHVFMGRAAGSLTDGALDGTVESDDESHKLTFRFTGNVEDGAFRGTHGYFARDGTLKQAGTLRLKRAG